MARTAHLAPEFLPATCPNTVTTKVKYACYETASHVVSNDSSREFNALWTRDLSITSRYG
eukprot:2383207-Pyramimonas_sp.AAC.1